jgi:hypothetical protein
VRSDIAVCSVHPAYVDTPTYLESGNHTGRELRPVPPVVEPERVAEQIVALAVRPRRSARVGALNLGALPYALAPDPVGRLTARLLGRYLLHTGRRVAPDAGGLFHPVAGPAETRGGWGDRQRRRARTVVALAAGAVAVGAVATRRR